MKKFIFIFVLVFLFFIPVKSYSIEVVCTANWLNVRSKPNKNASKCSVHFEEGDVLNITGEKNNGWYKLDLSSLMYDSSTGEFWVSCEYISEIIEETKWTNYSGGRVFVRDKPEGEKTGKTIKNGQTIVINKWLDGWGCLSSGGWVDMLYFGAAE